jgi:thiamine-phosphate diphosphorylase
VTSRPAGSSSAFDAGDLRVIAITDNLRDGLSGLVARARAARRGGATMMHVRLPDDGARILVEATRGLVESLDIPVLVHDRLDVALAAGARGVHLSVGGIRPVDARRLTPEGFIIGASAGSADEARVAAGADYLAIGPVFAAAMRGNESAIGLEGLRRLAELLGPVPVVALGGISERNASSVIGAGACGVALIAALLAAADPEAATRAIRASIGT